MKRYLNLRTNIAIGLIFAFLLNTLGPLPVQAQPAPQQAGGILLPAPGMMVNLSLAFTPAHLQGIIIHPDDPFKFDFLIHKGDGNLSQEQKKPEYTKLIKYFLASLTIPDNDQWVNLSPYEHNRIIADNFGKTQMGRDLLAQDYLLKQITSSLIYPEKNLGKKFWDLVYARAWKEYGTTNIPVNTFNKVWIIPDQAAVYESGNTVYILRDHLKVMLEEDYLSLKKHNSVIASAHTIGSQVIREIVLPALEKEVNEGKNFAQLRQIYSGMILATWYKHALKESLLGKVYANHSKVKGIDQNPENNEQIYQEYLQAFKKGVFNFIKDDADKYSKEIVPRKYFSGGIQDFGQLVTGSGIDKGFKDAAVLAVNDSNIGDLPGADRAVISSNPDGNAQDIDRVKTTLDPTDAAMGSDIPRVPEIIKDPTILGEYLRSASSSEVLDRKAKRFARLSKSYLGKLKSSERNRVQSKLLNILYLRDIFPDEKYGFSTEEGMNDQLAKIIRDIQTYQGNRRTVLATSVSKRFSKMMPRRDVLIYSLSSLLIGGSLGALGFSQVEYDGLKAQDRKEEEYRRGLDRQDYLVGRRDMLKEEGQKFFDSLYETNSRLNAEDFSFGPLRLLLKTSKTKINTIILNELGVRAGQVEKVPEERIVAAFNAVLMALDLYKNFDVNKDSKNLRESIRQLLARVQRSDSSITQEDRLVLNGALLEDMYPGGVSKLTPFSQHLPIEFNQNIPEDVKQALPAVLNWLRRNDLNTDYFLNLVEKQRVALVLQANSKEMGISVGKNRARFDLEINPFRVVVTFDPNILSISKPEMLIGELVSVFSELDFIFQKQSLEYQPNRLDHENVASAVDWESNFCQNIASKMSELYPTLALAFITRAERLRIEYQRIVADEAMISYIVIVSRNAKWRQRITDPLFKAGYKSVSNVSNTNQLRFFKGGGLAIIDPHLDPTFIKRTELIGWRVYTGPEGNINPEGIVFAVNRRMDRALLAKTPDAAMRGQRNDALGVSLVAVRIILDSLKSKPKINTGDILLLQKRIEIFLKQIQGHLTEKETARALVFKFFLYKYLDFIKDVPNQFGKGEVWERMLTLLVEMEKDFLDPQILSQEDIDKVNRLRTFMEENESNMAEEDLQALIDKLGIEIVASATPDQIPSNFKVWTTSGLVSAQDAREAVEAGRAMLECTDLGHKVVFFLVRTFNVEITREKMKETVFEDGQLMKITFREKESGRIGSMEVRYHDHDANFLGVKLPGNPEDLYSLSWDEHPIFATLLKVEVADKAMVDQAMKGGIDLNSANLDLQIRRDGRGVPLPIAQQDMAQLSHIQGFEPRILEIEPAAGLAIFSELQQKFISSSLPHQE